MKPVVLVGFMGSGKSTVARELGSKLHRPVIDLDDRVEREAGMTISRIFEINGEAGFRKLESEQLADSVRRQNVIIACGGGIVLMPENREALSESTVIYLRARAETLLARVGNADQRPLLQGKPSHAVAELLQEREHLYAEVADVTIDTDALSVGDVADLIAKAVSE